MRSKWAKIGVIAVFALIATGCSSGGQLQEEEPATVAPEKTDASTTEDKLAEMTARLDDYEGDQRAAMLHQLADVHLQRADEHFLASARTMDACVGIPQEGCRRDEAKDLAEESAHYHEEAVRILGEVLTSYPSYDFTDHVLFQRGYFLKKLDRWDAALEHFEEIIEEHDEGEYAVPVHLTMGDSFFDSEEFDRALSHFEAATKAQDSTVVGYAQYKAAWTHMTLGEFKAALDRIEKSLAATAEGDEESGALHRQALRDYARFLCVAETAPEEIRRRLESLEDVDAAAVREHIAEVCDQDLERGAPGEWVVPGHLLRL